MKEPGDKASDRIARILVVEDDEPVRRLISQILLDLGYDVAEATDGSAALALLAEAPLAVDLLLTDLVMPGMTGVELARRVSGSARDLRVLYMSGYSEELTLDPQAPLEATLLDKPFTPEKLVRKVKEALAGPPFSLKKPSAG